jgi:hypothetical protein
VLTLKTAWEDGTRHLVFEDPHAIPAILAAVAVSRELADRAPPFAASLDTSHAAAISA